MEAYIQGDTIKGDAKMKLTEPLYAEALAGCGKLGKSMNEWAQKINDLVARSDWPQISKQIYNEN